MTTRVKALACVIAVAATCTLVTASAVIAAGKRPHAGEAAKAVDRQTIVWRTGKHNRVFTSSAKWAELPMPTGGCEVGQHTCSGSSMEEPLIFAKGPISLTFSAVFSRAPVRLRFRDGGRLMPPGAVGFRPAPGAGAFSFTFVSPRKGERLCEGPALEWRSPSGNEVRLLKATVVVHYKKLVTHDPIGCA